MRAILYILYISILTIFFSCKEQTTNINNIPITTTKNKLIEEKNKSEEEKAIIKYENYRRVDSLRKDKILTDIFNFVKQNIELDNYYNEYKTLTYDSCYWVKVDITMGRLFSDKNKYLLIHRLDIAEMLLDLYILKNNKFIPIISVSWCENGYTNDTIKDINGDGFKDFLVNTHSISGCCRGVTSLVYLYLSKNGTFTKKYKFINPTFYPREKIIRGVGYGRPGEVGLYKYKWNGLKVDTVEFIYPDFYDKIFFIKTKKKTYYATENDGLKIKSVPKEYHNIKDYDWFTLYLQ